MQSALLQTNLREQIAEILRIEVLSGRFRAGEQLKEIELSQRFSISRGPIRDALLQLSKEGLLVAKPNRGVTVRSAPAPEHRKLLVKLRREIECHALRRILPGVCGEDVDFWRRNLAAFKAACEAADVAAVVRTDMAFHRSIVERAGGEPLATIWLPVMTQLNLPYSRHDDLLESYAEHRAIVEAIAGGDREAAVRNLEANIQ